MPNDNQQSYTLLNELLSKEIGTKTDEQGNESPTFLDPMAQERLRAEAFRQQEAELKNQARVDQVGNYAKDAHETNLRAIEKQKRIDDKIAGKNLADKHQLSSEMKLMREVGIDRYLRDNSVAANSYYSYEERNALAQRAQESQRQRLDRLLSPTNIGEDLLDLGASAASGGLNLAGALTGIAGRPFSDTWTNPVAEALFNASRGVKEFQSDSLTQTGDDTQADTAANRDKFNYLAEQGIDVNMIKQAYEDAGSVVDNMTFQSFFNMMVEEALPMYFGGFSGKGAALGVKAGAESSIASAKLLAEKAAQKKAAGMGSPTAAGQTASTISAGISTARGKASEATGKLFDKSSSAIGVGVTAAEGGAEDVMQELSSEWYRMEDIGAKKAIAEADILAAEFKDKYGYSVDKATEAFAKSFYKDKFNERALAKWGVALAVQGITGEAKFTKDIVEKGSKRGLVKSTASGGLEEGVVQASTNLIDQQLKDSTTRLAEGVGEATVQGAAASGGLAVSPTVSTQIGKGLEKFGEAKKTKVANQEEAKTFSDEVAKGEYKPDIKERANTIKSNFLGSTDKPISAKDMVKNADGDAASIQRTFNALQKSGIEMTPDEKARVGEAQDIINKNSIKYAEKSSDKIKVEEGKDLNNDQATNLVAGTVASSAIEPEKATNNLNAVTEAIASGNQEKDVDGRVLGSTPEAMGAAQEANAEFVSAKQSFDTSEGFYNPQGKKNIDDINKEVHRDITNWASGAIDAILNNDVPYLTGLVQSLNQMIGNKQADLDSGINPKTGRKHTEIYKATKKAEIEYAKALKKYIQKNAAISTNPDMADIDMDQTYTPRANPVADLKEPKLSRLTKGTDYTSLTPKGKVDILKAFNSKEMQEELDKGELDLSDETVNTLRNLGSTDADKRPDNEAVDAAYEELNKVVPTENVASFIESVNPEILKDFDEDQIIVENQEQPLDKTIEESNKGEATYVKLDNVKAEDYSSAKAVRRARKELEAKILSNKKVPDEVQKELNEANYLGGVTTKAEEINALNKIIAAVNQNKVPTTVISNTDIKPVSLTPKVNVVKTGVFSNLSELAKSLFNVGGKTTVANTTQHMFGGLLKKTDGNYSNQFLAVTNGLSEVQRDQLYNVMSTLRKQLKLSEKAIDSKEYQKVIKGMSNSNVAIELQNGIPSSILGSLLYSTDEKGNLVKGNTEEFLNQFGIALLGTLTTNPLATDLATTMKALGGSELGNLSEEAIIAKFDNDLIGLIRGKKPLSMVHEDLGKGIAKSMGIKFNSSASEQLPDHTYSALGQLAVNMLEDMGVVKKDRVNVTPPVDSDGQYTTDPEKVKESKFTTVLSVVDGDHLLSELRDADLNKFFQLFTGSDRDPRGVQTEAPKTFKNNMGDKLSPDHQKAMDNTMGSPRKLFMEYANTLVNTYKADRDTFLRIMGIDIDSVLSLEEEGTQAKIDSMGEAIKWLEVVTSNPDQYKEIYQDFVLAKTGRIAEVSGLSPQANKMVRALMNAHQSSTTDVTNPTQLANFKVAVARAFNEDKGNRQESIDEFTQIFGNSTTGTPNLETAIRAYENISQGKPLDPNDEELLALIDKGKLHAETLQAIYAVGAYAKALDGGNSTFTNHLFREDDGLANGVYFLLTQFGHFTNDSDLVQSMQQVGVTIADGKDVVDLRGKPDFTDVYQSLGKSVTTHVQGFKDNLANKDINSDTDTKVISLRTLMDDVFEADSLKKVIRNIMKYPLMTFIYGAQEKSLKNTITTDFTDLMLKRVRDVQKAINEQYPNSADDFNNVVVKRMLEPVQDKLTALARVSGINAKGKVSFKKGDPKFTLTYDNTSGKVLIEYTPSKGDKYSITSTDQLNKIFSKGIDVLVATPAIESINNRYGKVGAVAKVFSDTVSTISKMYSADYTSKIAQIKGIVTLADQKRIVDELALIYPSIATAMSVEEDGLVLSGINIHKQELTRDTSRKDTQHTELAPSSKTGDKVSKFTSTAEVSMKDKSVQAQPYIAHSLDSAVIAKILMNNPDILQVYDGIVQDPNSTEATTAGNKAAKESIEYSPLEAASQALSKAIANRKAEELQESTVVQEISDGKGNKVNLTPTQLVQLTEKMHEATELFKKYLARVTKGVNQYVNIDGGELSEEFSDDPKDIRRAVIASKATFQILSNAVNSTDFDKAINYPMDKLLKKIGENVLATEYPDDYQVYQNDVEFRKWFREVDGKPYMMNVHVGAIPSSNEDMTTVLDNRGFDNVPDRLSNTQVFMLSAKLDKILQKFSTNPSQKLQGLANPNLPTQYIGDYEAVQGFMEKYGKEYLSNFDDKQSLNINDVFNVYLTHPDFRQSINTVLDGDSTLGSTPDSYNMIDDINIQVTGTIDSLDMNGLVDTLNTQDPNNHLMSSDHSSKLDDLISEVSKVYESTGTAVSIKAGKFKDSDKSLGNIDLSNNSVVIGVASTQSTNRVATTAKETIAHELVHPIWAWGIQNGFDRELNGIVADFIKGLGGRQNAYKVFLEGIPNPTPEEVATAKALAEYTLGDGKNNLDEFAAYAMTNENFIKSLSKFNRTKPEVLTGLSSKLARLFRKISESIFGKIYDANNGGKSLDKSVESLYADINKAYLNSRSTAVAQTRVQVLAERASSGTDKLFNKTDKLLKVGALSVATILGGSTAQLAKDTISAIDNSDPKVMKEVGNKVREIGNRLVEGLPIELKDYITQTMGNATDVARSSQAISRATALVDKASNDIEKEVYKHLKSLVPTGKEFDSIRGSAIRNGFLKADIPALLNAGYNLDSIKDMYADAKEAERVQLELANKVAALHNQGIGRVAYNVAKAFGGFQVNGASKYGTYMQNPQIAARTIAKEFDLDLSKEAEFITLLDQMMSVGTIQETHVNQSNATIHRELNDPEMSNYYAHLIQAAESTHENSKAVFEDSEKVMVKGYIQDVTNPNISVVTEGMHKRKQLEKDGYKWIKTVSTPANENVGIFTKAYGGSLYTSSSAFKRSSNESAGVGMADVLSMSGANGSGYMGAIEANEKLRQELSDELTQYYKNRPVGRLSSVRHNMVPLPSKDGSVFRFRARLIDESFKEDHLGLYNDPSASIANSIGSIQYKLAAPVSNKEIIKGIKDTATNEFHKNPDNFLVLDTNNLRNSKNKRFVRSYSSLDDISKAALDEAFPDGKLIIKRNQYTNLFGYDRFSVSDVVSNRLPEVRAYNEMVRISTRVIEPFVNNRIVKAAEYYTQEYVKEILKAIVVKTGTVTLGNMMGNMSLTLMMGMNPVTTTKDFAEGVTHAKDFINDLDRLKELQAGLISIPDTQVGKRDAINKEIGLLTESLKRSPMYDLYEDGHINHVVTDPANDITQIGTPKSKVREFFDDRFYNRVSPAIGNVAKELVGTEDSAIYSFMQQSVLMSDLGFKYAYKKHLETTGMAKEDIMDKVSYVFLNYDAPSPKGIDYLESLGFIMFSKFNMRFQRVLISTFLHSPSRALLAQRIMEMIAPMYNIADTSFLTDNELLNMFSNIIMNIFVPLSELPVVNLVGAFF